MACSPVPTRTPVISSEPHKIEFQTASGIKVSGTFIPASMPNAPTIVLMHGGGGRGDNWVQIGMVDWLSARSFAVFVFDYRGDWIDAGRAAVATAEALSGVDSAHIVTMGASVGGDSATDACAVSGCLGALAFSPVGSFEGVGYDASVAALEREGRAAWCIASEGEGGCPQVVGQYYRAIIKPGLAHGLGLFAAYRGDDIWRDVAEFLRIVLENRTGLDRARLHVR